jgi:DsbC/DsbD-like thiol-disulfide interchange protein
MGSAEMVAATFTAAVVADRGKLGKTPSHDPMRIAYLVSCCLLVIACSKNEPTREGSSATLASATVATQSATAAVVATAVVPAVAASVRLEDLKIGNDATTVHVAWKMPEGTGVNDEAPFRIRWKSSEGLAVPPDDVTNNGASVQKGFDVVLRPTKGTGTAELLGTVELVVCDVKTHSVCMPVKRKIEMRFLVGKQPVPTLNVSVDLPEARG